MNEWGTGLTDLRQLPRYEERTDGIYWKQDSSDVQSWVKLCNFHARITSAKEYSSDDNIGQNVVTLLVVEARMVYPNAEFEAGYDVGDPIELLLTAERFHSMKWLCQLECEAVVEVGSSYKKRIRHAIQTLSNPFRVVSKGLKGVYRLANGEIRFHAERDEREYETLLHSYWRTDKEDFE